MTALPVHGIDISNHQKGELDFDLAKTAGLLWVYHKATEGTSFVDGLYDRRRLECREAGLPFGAYHFARPEHGDARSEARFFLDRAAPQPGDLVPVLDLETTEGLSRIELEEWARTFADYVRDELGVFPILYGPWDLDERLARWVPSYSANNGFPPKEDWQIWQFSDGVLGDPNYFCGVGRVDLNTMADDFTLEDMLIPQPERELFHILHASQEWRDSDTQTLADIRAALARKPHVATFTEVSRKNGNLALLRKAAGEHGYVVLYTNHSDGAGSCMAVRRDVQVLRKGSQRVNPGEKGKPPLGGHSPREAAWAVLGWHGEKIFVVTAHWVTGWPKRVSRRRKHETMSRAIAELVEKNAEGRRLAFWTGDTNAPDRAADTPQYRILSDARLTTVWDELKKYPRTHGKATIDVIGTYDKDVRVVTARARAWPQGNSDHRQISAWFRIRA